MKKRMFSIILSMALVLSALTGCAAIDPAMQSEALNYIGGVDLSEYGLTPEALSETFLDSFFNTLLGLQEVAYNLPGADKAVEIAMSNTDYFERLSQTDLDLRLQKEGATIEEYKALLASQVKDFTPEEERLVNDAMADIQERLYELGFTFPVEENVSIIKTTMAEEPGAGAYTHGNDIYIGEEVMELVLENKEEYGELFDTFMAHELFHVMSRNDKEFKENMYRLIGFTLEDEEPDFSPEVREKLISNPDVEKYDAHATFTIDGVPTEAVIVSYCDEPYAEGDVLLDKIHPGLVPIDKPDRIVPFEEVPDFFDVVGYNTGYVDAAEEVLADNFKYAIVYGADESFGSPEILDGMLRYMATGEPTVQVTGEAAAEAAEEEEQAKEEAVLEKVESIESEDALEKEAEEAKELSENVKEETAEAEEPEASKEAEAEEAETSKEAEASGDKSVEEIAEEVVKGLWGNGVDRVEALEEAGYDPAAVQAVVNELMK